MIVAPTELDTVADWRGKAGDAYTARNPLTADAVQARCDLWSDILLHLERPQSICEVGANIGINLRALRIILSKMKAACLYAAIEPNAAARAQLVRDQVVDKIQTCVDFDDMFGRVDLIFTSGVLIHIPPDDLLDFCRRIHAHAGRYIVAVEYFAAEPEEKPYRGPAGKLWKRDFGAFYLDNFPDLKPLAFGFAWKRMTGLDDLTWVVLEKQ